MPKKLEKTNTVKKKKLTKKQKIVRDSEPYRQIYKRVYICIIVLVHK